MAELVYVLTHAKWKHVKIGHTKRTVRQRMNAINSNIPKAHPYRCFYDKKVSNARLVEKELHSIFEEKRESRRGEFFRVSPYLVKKAITVMHPSESAEQRKRRRLYHIRWLQIDAGEELQFTKRRSITCRFVANGKVYFRNQILSVSAAAKQALKTLGYDRQTVNGNDYWEYKSETLADRRWRLRIKASLRNRRTSQKQWEAIFPAEVLP